MMYGYGKSDRLICSLKPPNKGAAAAVAAEEVEGRGLPKGNSFAMFQRSDSEPAHAEW